MAKRKKNPRRKGAAKRRASKRAAERRIKTGKRRGRFARTYVASRGPGERKRMRTYVRRNKHGKRLGHVRGWPARRRRANGSSGLLAGAIALAAGVVVSVGVSFLIDQTLSSQSATVQDAVLVGAAAVAAWFVPNPALVGGIVTGLLLVPAAKLIYTAVPSLASTNVATNPEAILGTAAATSAASTTPAATTQQGLYGMGALQPRGTWGALHGRKSWGALQEPDAFSYPGVRSEMGALNARGDYLTSLATS